MPGAVATIPGGRPLKLVTVWSVSTSATPSESGVNLRNTMLIALSLKGPANNLGVLLLHCCLALEDLASNVDEVSVVGVCVGIRYTVTSIPRCLFGDE